VHNKTVPFRDTLIEMFCGWRASNSQNLWTHSRALLNISLSLALSCAYMCKRTDVTCTATSCLLCRGQLKCDGTRAETRFRLTAKWTSAFKSAGASVQSTTGSRGVRISGSNTLCSEVAWRVLVTQSIRQFPLHFPSRASPFAITFQLDYTAPKDVLLTV